jgi:hypothetical protein
LDVATGEGGEGATFGGIKQLDGPDQADVAPLDEIDEKRAATLVSAGDRSDQVKTPLQQPLPGEVIVVPLDRWPEPPLLLGSEWRDALHHSQIVPERIGWLGRHRVSL